MKKTISKIIIGLIALLAVFAVGCGYNNYITKKVMEKVEVQLAGREAQEFGAYYPVAAGTYYLAGSGIGTTDTSITLRSFTDPFSGEEYTMSDFGDIGYATIDPGTSKKEFISFTGISQDPNSSEATLTGVSRGLQGKYPYTASSTLAKSHSGGAKLIISNPPQHYEKYANRERNQTISGVWTFSSSSPPRYNTDSYSFITGLSYLVNKAYVDNVATSGAADASTNTKGLVEQATLSELMSSASSGDTTAPLFVPNQYFSTSSSATTSVVVTKSNGKINQNFWDLTEDFTWSGEHTFNGTTTLATTTINYITFDEKGFYDFGDGSDGDVTISSTTTLTEDMYYNNLTVNSGVALNTGGYRIYVKDTLTVNGVMRNNGSDGGDGGNGGGTSGGSGGTGGSGGAGGSLPAAPDGGNGGVGGYDSGGNGDNGSPGSSGIDKDPSLGSSGVAGGSGGNTGTSSGGAGGSGGTATSENLDIAYLVPHIQAGSETNGKFIFVPFGSVSGAYLSPSASSGGGGGGAAQPGAAQYTGGGGGGAGGSGGIVLIVAKNITGSGNIEAKGGNGGNGGNGHNDGGGGGGGAGGAGGVVILVYKDISGFTGSVDVSGGTGGSGGAGDIGSNGNAGSNGNTGKIYKIKL